jgi:hypothetical protein
MFETLCAGGGLLLFWVGLRVGVRPVAIFAAVLGPAWALIVLALVYRFREPLQPARLCSVLKTGPAAVWILGAGIAWGVLLATIWVNTAYGKKTPEAEAIGGALGAILGAIATKMLPLGARATASGLTRSVIQSRYFYEQVGGLPENVSDGDPRLLAFKAMWYDDFSTPQGQSVHRWDRLACCRRLEIIRAYLTVAASARTPP